jgi:tyrosinase
MGNAQQHEEPSRLERVRGILDTAAGSAEPGYDNQGRFWNRTPSELEATSVYGVAMIAPAGTRRRGASSGLIAGLRGERPFDGTQFPPLPWGGTRVGAQDIRFITDWIDDGLPEVDGPPPPRPRPDVEVLPDVDETEDPNAHRERIGAIKARHDVEHLSATELANLRAAVAELKALDQWPRDRRSYAAWAQMHGDECPHGWSIFLPWHRMYLWGFEQQLQDRHPTVTLPYWDWTQSTREQIADGYIPQAYRCGVDEELLRLLSGGKVSAAALKQLKDHEDATYNSISRFWKAHPAISSDEQQVVIDALETVNPLFTAQRWPGEFGLGKTVENTFTHHYPTPADIERMLGIDRWRDFGGGRDVDQSFGIVDMDPHNTMHIWIGGAPEGMGPGKPQGYMLANLTAALDPIFWAHHGNVDRIWALWQERHPGVDPPDPSDVLQGVHATVQDSLSITKLGYEYAADTHLLAADTGQPAATISTPPAGAVPVVLSSHRRAELRLHRIRQPKQSMVVRVFLNAPDADGMTPLDGNIHYAGHFALFGHGPCVGGPGHCDPRPRVRPFDTRSQDHNEPWNMRYDVTDAVAALVAEGATDIDATLVVVDLGGDDGAAKLDLDGISLSFHD